MDELLNLFNKPFSIKDVKLFSDGGGDSGQGGGDDADDTGDDTGDGGANDTGNDQNADSGNQDGGDDAGKKTFDEEYVKSLRAENAKYRTNAKQFAEEKQQLESQIKSIQKALGLDDGEADDKALEDKLNQKEAELRNLKVENAFSKVARKAGADEDLTLAVLHRKGKLSDLDPDDDLESSLKGLVEQELENNPKLKAEYTQTTNTGDTDSQDKEGSKLSFNDLFRQVAGRAK